MSRERQRMEITRINTSEEYLNIWKLGESEELKKWIEYLNEQAKEFT